MEEIWKKIVMHQGEVFHTKSGKELIYQVDDDEVTHNQTKVKLKKTDFEKAIRLNPQNVQEIRNEVTGPSYIFAIITDDRITE